MAAYYCLYHKRYITKIEVSKKECKAKGKTKEPCRYLTEKDKQKYRNCSKFLKR